MKENVIKKLVDISKHNESIPYDLRPLSVAAIAINANDPNEVIHLVNSKTDILNDIDSHAEMKIAKALDPNKNWNIVISTSPCEGCENELKKLNNIKDIKWIINNCRKIDFNEKNAFSLKDISNNKLKWIRKYIQHFINHQNHYYKKSRYGYSVKLNWDKTTGFFSTKKVEWNK